MKKSYLELFSACSASSATLVHQSKLAWCLALTVFWAGASQAQAQTSGSYFRSDSGIARDSPSLPDDFSTDAKLLWRTEMLPGHSTPCVVGDRIFLTTFDAESKQLATVALDRTSGKLKWSRPIKTDYIEPVHTTGSPATSSPACNGQLVFSFFGSFGLVCYDLEGNLQWELPLGPFQDEFGAASSPILVDDKIILNQDHDINSFLIAIDQRTGKVLWKSPRDQATRSYSTPVILQRDGKKQILVAGSLQLAAYDSETGAKRWWYNGISRIVDSTPVVKDGVVYIATWTPGGDSDSRITMEPFADALKTHDKNADSKISRDELPKDSPVLDRFFRIDLDQDSGLDSAEWARHAAVFEQAQNVALALDPGSEGSLDPSEVRWTHTRGLPTVPSSVVFDGVLTMVKDSGIITVLDSQTGKQLQQLRAAGQGNYYASLVAGDGKVYMISEQGVLTTLKSGASPKILSSHNFSERVMATPVIKDGLIYIRTESAIYCYTKA
jgi:outer membrane protein assembly factor BamB